MTSDYKIYIVNNEYVSDRNNGGPANYAFTISASYFAVSESNGLSIFQMLKDTYFNYIINNHESYIECYIIAIKDTGKNTLNKQIILDYMNSGDISHIDTLKQRHNICVVTQFHGNVGNDSEKDSLIINSDKNYNLIYKDTNIVNEVNDVKLSFIVNHFEENNHTMKYISNPCFTVNNNCLNTILSQ
jgi:hypothetical protein